MDHASQDILKQLKKTEDIYRLLFEAANDAILFMEWDKIIDANQKAVQLFGCKNKEELIGKSPVDFSPPYQPDGKSSKRAAREILKELLKTDAVLFEWVNVRKDGTAFFSEVSLGSFKEGKRRIVLAIFRDITERKRLEEEYIRTRQLETIGTMVGGIAHEFNNILNVVLGSAEILHKKIHDPKLKHWLDVIINQSQKGASLVAQLLGFCRREPIKPSPLDILPLVKETVKILKRILPENIEINFYYNPQTQYVVCTSPVDMQEILMDLAANARDAMPQGGKLKIALDKKKIKGREYIVLSVQDTGVGMSEEVLRRAFDPFFTTKPKGKAVGLGLTRVYNMVRQHKGFIELKSKMGKGTTVTIYLPMVEIKQEPIDKPVAAAIDKKVAILVMEDDPAVLEVLKNILSSAGYEVVTARNGKEGLELYEKLKDKIKVVVTDIVMPKLDGISFYKKAKKLNPDLKVLYITGYSIANFLGKKEGMVEVMQKPIVSARLINKVNKLLEKDV